MRPDRSWMMQRKDNNGQVTGEFKNGDDDFFKITKRQLGVADALGHIFCPSFNQSPQNPSTVSFSIELFVRAFSLVEDLEVLLLLPSFKIF
ncbi:hypothetical protein QL285_013478 [Trifolium repens]|nr:hypothetical protein QL285_013478 [Trifolium repens]